MPETEEKIVVSAEVEAVANITAMTTIPNSTAEFCIYTYKADHESYTQVTRKGFFNTAWSFVFPGDTIRVFRFDVNKKLTNFLELIVTDVDKILHTVDVAVIGNHNLEKKVI